MSAATARRLSLAAALATGAGAAACRSNHHVSPFPEPDAIAALLPRADLTAQLARMDAETAALRLTRVVELPCKLSTGEPCVVRGYEGRDGLGRPTRATRVATPYAIVLALGPGESAIAARGTALVASLVAGGWASGSDLNGDGSPDVVVRAEDGALAVFRVERYGATAFPVALAGAPTFALDADGDGRPDLAFAPPRGARDALLAELVDFATFAGDRYDRDAPSARAAHAALARRAADERARSAEGHDRAAELRAGVGEAWHAMRAGADAASTLARVDALAAELAPLGDGLEQSWVRARGVLAAEARSTRDGGAL